MAAALAAAVGGLAVLQHMQVFPGGMHAPTAGLIGLSLSYILPITGLLSSLLVTGAETEQEMVAVERISQYLVKNQTIALEPPSLQPSQSQTVVGERRGEYSSMTQTLLGTFLNNTSSNYFPQGVELDEGWPSQGKISFNNVWLRYTPQNPFVLQNLHLEIAPNSKVGICGRTGAGKSSLISCLLRLVDTSQGSICIDGVDIREVPLSRLRQAIGFVPQVGNIISTLHIHSISILSFNIPFLIMLIFICIYCMCL